MQELVVDIATTFFDTLGVHYEDLHVQEEAPNIFRISIKSDDSHLLIGPHGKNLDTLTHLLKLLVSKGQEDFIHLHVEINDYLAKKDEKLLNFIQSKIDIVKNSGKEMVLPFLTAYERKKVHSYVAEHWGNVYTQSQGEGKERRMHLLKKNEKMTIDIDGDDI